MKRKTYTDFNAYVDFVENLAKNQTNELFFNSGPTHAAIVMAAIFKYSNATVKMYSGGVNGAVSNDEEYLRNLDAFLKRGKLVILADQDLSKSQNKIFKILRANEKNVEMYITPYRITLDGSNPIHFTVGDDTMVRIETDVNEYHAQVNFGNKKEASEFKEIFREMLRKPGNQKITLA